MHHVVRAELENLSAHQMLDLVVGGCRRFLVMLLSPRVGN